MQPRIITYKGYTIELGELPGPRQAYWKVSDTHLPGKWFDDIDVIHEVECGSYEDLEKIAKREIDNAETKRI